MSLNLEPQSAATERIWAPTRGGGSSGQPPRRARAATAATARQLLASGCLRLCVPPLLPARWRRIWPLASFSLHQTELTAVRRRLQHFQIRRLAAESPPSGITQGEGGAVLIKADMAEELDQIWN